MVLKRFIEWFSLKTKLDSKNHQPPLVNIRDIWWVSFGENVGSEMDGKSDKFTRPAIILKKLSHSFYLVAPSTSQPHEGSWYVKVSHADKPMFICLHQIRTIDYRRLYSKLGRLDEPDFLEIISKLRQLYW